MAKQKEPTHTIKNFSRILYVYKPNQGGGYDFVNAPVVNGYAVTVGHIPTDTLYTVLDPIASFYSCPRIHSRYASVDHQLDAGTLDLDCTGKCYAPGTHVDDEEVTIRQIFFKPDGGLMNASIPGQMYGEQCIGGKRWLPAIKINGDLPDAPGCKSIITCGAAVTDRKSARLYGIINKASYGDPEDPESIRLVNMAPIAEILKISKSVMEEIKCQISLKQW